MSTAEQKERQRSLREAGNRYCPRCETIKALDQFTIRKTGERIGEAVAHCKQCSTRGYIARAKADGSLYRRVQWPSKIKRLYGITANDYFRMLEEQGGGCAICKSKTPGGRNYKRMGKPEMFYVDHCHSSGRVRGLLCNACNRAIGYLRDDPEIVLRAHAYLLASEDSHGK